VVFKALPPSTADKKENDSSASITLFPKFLGI
jgi:hypothetical protein